LADRPFFSEYEEELAQLRQRLAYGALFFLALIAIGASGYRILSPEANWMTAIYMTITTLTTVGFGEFIEPTPVVRVWTIVILLVGAGTVAYFFTIATAFVVEGSLGHVVWRRRMNKTIASYSYHYIICGNDETATYAANELLSIRQPVVLIADTPEKAQDIRREFPEMPLVVGDATSDDVLQSAGISRCAGVIACSENTKDNLLITLTARQMNPHARIITRVAALNHEQKARNAGASAVVCPTFTGGMRLVSEMVRPTVVSFLDIMLRDRDKNLRVEEVPIGAGATAVGTRIGDINFRQISNALLLACKVDDGKWVYNPPLEMELMPGYTLIVMGSPEDVTSLRAALNGPVAEVLDQESLVAEFMQVPN
jgi:voltage-gated potassium channel